METDKEPVKEGANGALLGSIIVILLLIIGSIYIGQNKIKEIKQMQNPVPVENQVQP